MSTQTEDKRFIIVSAPRTGSTLLRRILDGLSEVTCHGEVFSADHVYGISQKAAQDVPDKLGLEFRNNYPLEFLSALGLTNRGQSVGCKILYHDLLSPSAACALSYLRGETGIRIVHLWRRDMVQRYLSECRLFAGYAHASAGDPRSRVSVTIDVSERDFITRTNNLVCAASYILDLFRTHPVINVVYEDLLSSAVCRNQLVLFLGLVGGPDGFSIPSERVSHKNKHVEIVIPDIEGQIERLRARTQETIPPAWLVRAGS